MCVYYYQRPAALFLRGRGSRKERSAEDGNFKSLGNKQWVRARDESDNLVNNLCADRVWNRPSRLREGRVGERVWLRIIGFAPKLAAIERREKEEEREKSEHYCMFKFLYHQTKKKGLLMIYTIQIAGPWAHRHTKLILEPLWREST